MCRRAPSPPLRALTPGERRTLAVVSRGDLATECIQHSCAERLEPHPPTGSRRDGGRTSTGSSVASARARRTSPGTIGRAPDSGVPSRVSAEAFSIQAALRSEAIVAPSVTAERRPARSSTLARSSQAGNAAASISTQRSAIDACSSASRFASSSGATRVPARPMASRASPAACVRSPNSAPPGATAPIGCRRPRASPSTSSTAKTSARPKTTRQPRSGSSRRSGERAESSSPAPVEGRMTISRSSLARRRGHLGHELLVHPPLHDTAAVEDDDLVAVANRAQPMSHDEASAASRT